ncbi:hypothetical protein LEMLEM_LOCUS1290 [Lemmus lemmus]
MSFRVFIALAFLKNFTASPQGVRQLWAPRMFSAEKKNGTGSIWQREIEPTNPTSGRKYCLSSWPVFFLAGPGQFKENASSSIALNNSIQTRRQMQGKELWPIRPKATPNHLGQTSRDPSLIKGSIELITPSLLCCLAPGKVLFARRYPTLGSGADERRWDPRTTPSSG